MDQVAFDADFLRKLGDLAEFAKKQLDGAAAQPVESSVQVAEQVTVRAWGKTWLERRVSEGMLSASEIEVPIWRMFVETSELADLPLRAVTRPIVRAWWTWMHARTVATPHWQKKHGGRLLSVSRLKQVLTSLRQAFGDALEEGLIDTNHFEPLRVHRSRRALTKLDSERVLRPREQEKVLAALPEVWRLPAMVAMGTGLRKGEQWGLRWTDVDLDSAAPCAIVRYGRPRKGATKGKRARRIPLFGMALFAMRRWRDVASKYHPKNPLGLVFPGKGGRERSVKSHPSRTVRRIGAVLGRHFTWHNFRHTCGTSLLAGWWGDEGWKLERVCALLGHASVRTTEHYAKVADELAFVAVHGQDDFPWGSGGDADAWFERMCTLEVSFRRVRSPGLRKSREGTVNKMSMTIDREHLEAQSIQTACLDASNLATTEETCRQTAGRNDAQSGSLEASNLSETKDASRQTPGKNACDEGVEATCTETSEAAQPPESWTSEDREKDPRWARSPKVPTASEEAASLADEPRRCVRRQAGTEEPCAYGYAHSGGCSWEGTISLSIFHEVGQATERRISAVEAERDAARSELATLKEAHNELRETLIALEPVQIPWLLSEQAVAGLSWLLTRIGGWTSARWCSTAARSRSVGARRVSLIVGRLRACGLRP